MEPTIKWKIEIAQALHASAQFAFIAPFVFMFIGLALICVASFTGWPRRVLSTGAFIFKAGFYSVIPCTIFPFVAVLLISLLTGK